MIYLMLAWTSCSTFGLPVIWDAMKPLWCQCNRGLWNYWVRYPFACHLPVQSYSQKWNTKFCTSFVPSLMTPDRGFFETTNDMGDIKLQTQVRGTWNEIIHTLPNFRWSLGMDKWFHPTLYSCSSQVCYRCTREAPSNVYKCSIKR